MLAVPDPVRRKALAAGAGAWLADLPELVAGLERDWSVRLGRIYPDATEALVAEVTGTGADSTFRGVLKLVVPRDGLAGREITALSLAAGSGCAPLLRHDRLRGALLLPRLGPSMADQGLPLPQRDALLCDAARRVWRPAPGCGLPTGADQARRLAGSLVERWQALGRPCSRAAVDHALECAARREAGHDDARAVLVHGDVHQWNALRDGDRFTLVDPDGLLAEPEYDLGVLLREDPEELLSGDPADRVAHLIGLAGGRLDPIAAWEWGVVERVSTGLVLAVAGVQPVAGRMLAAADRIAARYRRPGPVFG